MQHPSTAAPDSVDSAARHDQLGVPLACPGQGRQVSRRPACGASHGVGAQEGRSDDGSGGTLALQHETRPYVYFCVACASLNSCNLGFDIGVCGGAMFVARDQLGLSDVHVSVIVSSLALIAVLGSALSRPVSDNLGRTRTLALSSLLFMAGSVVMAAANSFSMLLFGRVVLGVGVGAGLSIDPLYISEVSPPRIRGFMVCCSELAINVGIMLGFVATYALSFGDPSWSWRVMLALGAVLPLLMLYLSLCAMPESPRLLVRQGHVDEAERVLARLTSSPAEAAATMDDIRRSIREEQEDRLNGWAALCPPNRAPPPVRLMLLVVLVIAAAQQASGVEAFMYFTPIILENVGFTSQSAVLGITACMGVAKTVTLVVTALMLDRKGVGRRPLLMVSYAGMAVSLVLLAVGAATSAKGVMVTGVFGYVVTFSLGSGPICWLFASEILPTAIRARGMTLAAGSNRFIAFVVSLSFLSATGSSAVAAFLCFAAVCATVVWFVHTQCPETTGRTLEEMYDYFTDAAQARGYSSSRNGHVELAEARVPRRPTTQA